jgi:glycosyltransferase involved in cell wall biosynthesis
MEFNDISMENKILSVCIPVYNRINLLKLNLECIVESIKKYNLFKEVEIIISDNNSTDDITGYVSSFTQKFKEISITFNKNKLNKGLAYNFIKVVDLSKAEFCWIVGSDDFITPDSLNSIISLIKSNEDVSFINFPIENIEIKNFDKNLIKKLLKEKANNLLTKRPFKTSTLKWDFLVDPFYKNVLLGSMMVSVFKRELWNKVDKSTIIPSLEFTNLQNTYPHCYIFSQSMIGKISLRTEEPMIIVGNGAREWATETGQSFWKSSIPLIKLNIFDEIINSYETGGLESNQVKKARHWSGLQSGYTLAPYLFLRYVMNFKVKSSQFINLKKIICTHSKNPYFYFGIILWLPHYIYLKIRTFISSFWSLINKILTVKS